MPKSADVDSRRQEFILNILLLGANVLSLAAFLITVYNSVVMGASYKGAPPLMLLSISVIFLALYAGARLGFYRPVAYIFTAVFFLAATVPLATKGVAIIQTMSIYSLIVVMTGVLIGSRAAFAMAGVTSTALFVFTYLSQTGRIHASQVLTLKSESYGDTIVSALIFVLIALVSWLANRDIKRSLRRAQASEAALKQERDNLEAKVRERTKELEKAQMERTLQLQRFAEFGRVSATLIHDLASPLTAVSISLSQLEDRHRSGLLEEARQSAAAMERYVVAARQQLHHETEITDFDPADEIRRITARCNTKAKPAGVRIELDITRDITLHGSSVQFDHIVSNLIANAIDAYQDAPDARNKVITLQLLKQRGKAQLIVTDHGGGIQPRDLPRVFDAFYTTKYSADNLGLGLSMVKHLIETGFAGTITASSSRKRGTRFNVTVPAS